MAKRKWKKEIKYYDYECTLTGEKFRMLKEAPNSSELVSVRGYYELHPEKDDRPEVVKKRSEAEEVTRASYEEPSEETSEEVSTEASLEAPVGAAETVEAKVVEAETGVKEASETEQTEEAE